MAPRKMYAELPIVSSSSSPLEEPPRIFSLVSVGVVNIENHLLLCLSVRKREEPKSIIGNFGLTLQLGLTAGMTLMQT